MRVKNKNSIFCLMFGGVLALVSGCGKTENAAPPGKEAGQVTSAAKPEIAPKVETPAAATPAAATPPAAAPAVETPAKPAETVATPVQESAPKAVVAPAPATEKAPESGGPAANTLAGLSHDQMVQGLQAALAKGLQQAIARLGHDGGFLTNLNVKIPMPEKMQKVESALRSMKQEKLADDFVTTMNHAAEQAVPEAGAVFADALKQMTIQDATSILSGANDAATRYFEKTTQTNLYGKFYPIVQKATQKTGVTAAYKKVTETASGSSSLGSFGSAVSGSLFGKDSTDIDAYVTNKALDGLFKMVAEEEKHIRENPVARTTDILQKVFGALKKH
jgi:hypothetical protein